MLGMSFGLVFVPCAGPVLAAITVLSATGGFGAGLIVLTASFAIGVALPLLGFAIAGQRMAERIRSCGAHPDSAQSGWCSHGGDRGGSVAESDRFDQRYVPGTSPGAGPHRRHRQCTRGAGRPVGQAGHHRRGRRPADVRPVCRYPAQLLTAARARSRGHSGMAQLEATGTRGPARAGGAGRLLDVLVHQLPAHPALHHGLGCEVPAEGPHRDRGAQSRIRLRAGVRRTWQTTPSGSV